MHEVFLTAVVSDADFERATAVLEGLCAMSAWHSTQRVLYFNGPPKPRNLTLSPDRKQGQYARAWAELSTQLARQSFAVQVRYEVRANKDFGGNAPENGINYFNATPATLRWTDIPDPAGGRHGTQRPKIEIAGQQGLVAVLLENQHKFKSEIIEESHTFFQDNVEYSLVRYYSLPGFTSADGAPQPLPRLPAWPTPSHSSAETATPDQSSTTNMRLIDPANKWLLYVRKHVLEDNSPEKILRSHEELNAIREQLAGVFEFRIFDRRAHDTRILQAVDNMPKPLPQKIKA